MSGKVAWGIIVAVGAGVCASLAAVAVRVGLGGASGWEALAAALSGVVAAVAAVLALVPKPPLVDLPPEVETPKGVVDRPDELKAIVTALVKGRGKTVGITAGLYGAGGFGKTTLAKIACSDKRVRRKFRGLIYWVEIGQDLRGPVAIATKVNHVLKLMTGEDVTFTDPKIASDYLGMRLNTGRRRLMILDDVWNIAQLDAFTQDGRRCTRLITTRVSELLDGHPARVEVGPFKESESRIFLSRNVPQLDAIATDSILETTGRWPLMLEIIATSLADLASTVRKDEAKGQAEDVLVRVRRHGPTALDELVASNTSSPDLRNPGERAKTVRANMAAGMRMLSQEEITRFSELGVFVKKEAIPFHLVASLWNATAGLDRLQSAALRRKLADTSLIIRSQKDSSNIMLHDVICDYLRSELGPQRLSKLNGMLLDAVEMTLPKLVSPQPAAQHLNQTAWWGLEDDDRYLWNHLIDHLEHAGRWDQSEMLACDLRWAAGRLQRFGQSAPVIDLATVGTPRAIRLRADLERTMHLLAPTQPAASVVDILFSRMGDHPDWTAQISAGNSYRDNTLRLVNRWPLPDRPDPALLRVLTGHLGAVNAVAISPDDSWLASGGADGTVRIWDLATGQGHVLISRHRARVSLIRRFSRQDHLATGHEGPVLAVAFSSDGKWLVSGDDDGKVLIWSMNARQLAAIGRVDSSVVSVAVSSEGLVAIRGVSDDMWEWMPRSRPPARIRVGRGIGELAPDMKSLMIPDWARAIKTADHRQDIAPSGTWRAEGTGDSRVLITEEGTNVLRGTLIGHRGQVNALAISSDSKWLATAGGDGQIRLWNSAAGPAQESRGRSRESAFEMQVSLDGWISARSEQSVMRWEVATGRLISISGIVSGPATVSTIAASPAGGWLAIGFSNGEVKIYDGAKDEVKTVKGKCENAIPNVSKISADGTWLAIGYESGEVFTWDRVTSRVHILPNYNNGTVKAMAMSPDSTRLITSYKGGDPRVWERASYLQSRRLRRGSKIGNILAVISDSFREGPFVSAIEVSPNSDWLATTETNGKVKLWDLVTGKRKLSLQTRKQSLELDAISISPDSQWLVTGGRRSKMLELWDSATGERLWMTELEFGISLVAFSPDGMWIAACDANGTVQIVDADSGGQRQAMMRVDGIIDSCAWVDNETLAFGGSAGVYLFDFRY